MPLPNNKPKLIQVLQSLPTSQLSKLLKLMRSPYFHQTDGVLQLFKHLRKFHPRYPIQKVSDEALAQQMFPDMKNGTKKIRNFKSDLMKLVEQFLVLEQFSKQESQYQFLLAQSYHQLQLPNYAQRSLKKAALALEESPIKGIDFYTRKIQFEHYQYFHPDTLKVGKNHDKLKDLLDLLDLYFILAKNKYVYEAQERMSKLNEKFDLRFWKEVQIEASKKDNLPHQESLFIYQQLHQLSAKTSFDKKSFTKLKNNFFYKLPALSPEDQQAIFKYLINYIIAALNSGQPDLAIVYFELLKEGLTNGLYIWKERMTSNSFLNIIIVALTCKAFDWIEKFIIDYQDFLNPAMKDNVLKITRAFIHFHKQNPEKALSIILNTRFEYPNLELFSLLLRIKCMFDIFLQDQTYQATILSQLDGLSNEFSNKFGFSKVHLDRYLSFVNFIKQLVKAFSGRKCITETRKIQKQLKTASVVHKSWLLKKCDQMIAIKQN